MLTWLFIPYLYVLLVCCGNGEFIDELLDVRILGSGKVVKEEGDQLRLECIVNKRTAVSFYWLHNGNILPYNKSVFLIDHLKLTDYGEYYCAASDYIGTLLSASVKVDVLYLYGFVEESKRKIIVPLNHGFFIEAPRLNASEGIRDYVTWRWYKQNEELRPGNDCEAYVTLSGDLVVLKPSCAERSYYARVFYKNNSFISQAQIVSNDYSDPSEPRFRILYGPKNKDIIRGEDRAISFECFPSHLDQSVAIQWTSNVQSISRFFVMENYNTRLSINNSVDGFKERVIQVVCEATFKGAYKKSKIAVLQILEKPSITFSNGISKILSKYVGEFVEIKCVASGYPKPNVKWLYENRVVSNGTVLRLSNIKPIDFGYYQCLASNLAGTVIDEIWIRNANAGSAIVRLHDDVADEGPQLLDSSSNITASIGDSVQLSCKFSNEPQLFIWKFNGEPLKSGKKYEITTHTLKIRTIRSEDAGFYTCIAENQFGSAEGHIFLEIRVDFIEYGPTNTSILIGSDVEVPCKVRDAYRNRNDLSISWLSPNGPIQFGGNAGVMHGISISSNGTLRIQEVRPDNIGRYTCIVRIGSSEQQISAWLKVIEKPSPPSAVKAELLNDTNRAIISVSWKQGFDGNSPLIKHIVEMRNLGPTALWSDWEIVAENIPAEFCCTARIDNLKPSLTVEFRVIAVNRYGQGKPSLPSNNVTTPQQPPAAAPRNVVVNSQTSSSLLVKWQPPLPEQWNGNILGYIVRYRLANYAGLNWIYKNVSDGGQRSVVLDHLITWRDYEVQVAAYNYQGMGVFSKSLYVTTLEGVPAQAPKDVVANPLNSTAVVVSFNPPDPQMVPGFKKGYKIDFWKGSVLPENHFRQVNLPPDDNTVSEVIGGLEKFESYNVTVLCYTGPGDGPRSDAVEVTTMEDVPGAVDSVRFDNLLFSSVDVIWNPPQEKNGIIRKYIVSYSVDGETTDRVYSHTVDDGSTNVTLENLTPATHYIVKIQAFTNVGGGPTVETKFISGVPPELPEQPTLVKISDIGSRNVTINFVPGFDGHTFIQRWIVEGKMSSSSTFQRIFEIKAPKAKSFVVQKLRPFTTYQLRIIAENVRGKSPPSEISDPFTTLAAEPEVAPEILFAEPVTATSVSIVWTPLRSVQWNGYPKGYLILYRAQLIEQDSVWKETRVSNNKISDFVLSDLRPFTVYQVVLLAENSVGRSKKSETITVKTYEDVPSGAPTDVRLDMSIPKTGTVFWKSIDANSANGVITGYKIRLIPEEEHYRSEFSRITEVEKEASQAIFTNLRPFTQYRAFVCAFTIVGLGPENSSATSQTEEDVPGEPYNVGFSYISETEVRLKWNPPLNQNGFIINYEIVYWEFGSEKEATKIELPFNVYGFSGTGLRRLSHYKFAIAARTSVGWGPKALVSVYTGNSTFSPPVPSTPESENLGSYSSTGIRFKWDVPMFFYGSTELNLVRFTDVQYRSDNSSWIQLPNPVSGTKSDAVITRLRPNTAYQVRIRFNTDFEQSLWSSPSAWMRTLSDAPSAAPTILQTSPLESSSLLLLWTIPSKEYWNSDEIRFLVSYRIYFSNDTVTTEEVKMTNQSASEFQYVLRKLKSFHHYLVQVQIINDFGVGPYSSPSFTYVGYSIPKDKVRGVFADAVTSTTIIVKWDLWNGDSEDVISGFKIRYVPVLPVLSMPSDDTLEELFVSENNSVVLTDLRKYTEYQISVSAYNRAGEGEVTTVRATTLEDRPGPVSGLFFSDILLDSVNVTWNAPAEPNGKILGYLVNYTTNNWRDEFKRETKEKTTSNYLVATGLEPNITYIFSVRAETSVGYGKEVVGNVSIAPTSGCPNPPSKPRLLPGQISVSLEWHDGSSGDGPIKGYIIQAKRVAHSREPQRSVLSEDTGDVFESSSRHQHVIGEWITLANVQGRDSHCEVVYRQLEASSFYVFRVFARNLRGAGYGSPESDQLYVPASLPDDPFYTKWWFIVMVALVIFVIIVVVVAFLCVTGSRYKYAKRGSFGSPDPSGSNIADYEMRTSRKNFAYARRCSTSRPSTNNFFEPDEPPAYGSIGESAEPRNTCGSLTADAISAEGSRFLLESGFGRPCSASACNYEPMLAGVSNCADRSDFDDTQEQESNIAQHYGQEDFHKLPWRRAREEALAEANSLRQSRPVSCVSNHSDMLQPTSLHNMHGSSVINGTSAYV